MYYYCIVFFEVQNLVLCLTRELIKFIDYRIMLKLQCKTHTKYTLKTKGSVFSWKLGYLSVSQIYMHLKLTYDLYWPIETCKKYSVTVIFHYIFHIKPHFLKTLFQISILVRFWRFLFPTKAELNVVLHCNFSIIL
jgi:hypothetical protein